MKPIKKVGIKGYGAYIPRYRLPTKDISRIWKGSGREVNEEKSIAGIDEDSCTMAVEAARRALVMAKVDNLGAIFVGTESKPYAVKPTSTIVAEALGKRRVLASDFEFACKAGTEAMQCIIGLVGSGMIENGLAIASDTAQGRPNDELEYTASSGAVAYVISELSDCIAEIEYTLSYVTDTGDFWRRQGQEYPRHLGRFTGEPAYLHHTLKATGLILEETNSKPSDFDYVVFHQPNPKFPLEAGKRLGFKESQMLKGLLNPLIGNTYAASALLGLARVLDDAKPDERILLVSFGSGAGSDAIILRVLNGIDEKRKGHLRIEEMIKERIEVDYSLYAKFRGKLKV
ncbi:MAG: hydroxymethylglutaryl-CoA synthase [Nitrososphaerales archaeon]